MCSVLHCSSILVCAEPRADGDEAEVMDADLIAGKIHMFKKVLDDSTDPGFYDHHQQGIATMQNSTEWRSKAMLTEAKASNRSVTNQTQSSMPTNSGKRTGALQVQQFQQRVFLPHVDLTM